MPLERRSATEGFCREFAPGNHERASPWGGRHCRREESGHANLRKCEYCWSEKTQTIGRGAMSCAPAPIAVTDERRRLRLPDRCAGRRDIQFQHRGTLASQWRRIPPACHGLQPRKRCMPHRYHTRVFSDDRSEKPLIWPWPQMVCADHHAPQVYLRLTILGGGGGGGGAGAGHKTVSQLGAKAGVVHFLTLSPRREQLHMSIATFHLNTARLQGNVSEVMLRLIPTVQP